VEAPRPVRIAKSTSPARVVRVPAKPSPDPVPVVTNAEDETVTERDNAPARARAWRIGAIYLVALAAMYAGFLALELRGPRAGGALATDALVLFSAVAAALAVGGLVVTLGPVPRSIEVTPTAVVVVEWTGRRRKFPALDDLRVDVVRRYSANFLSSAAVETVEVSDGRRRRTYQLTTGLLAEHRPTPKSPVTV
jgi:hypothetical protein